MRLLHLAWFALFFVGACALPAVENGAVSCAGGLGCAASPDLAVGAAGNDVDLAEANPSADLSPLPVDLAQPPADMAQTQSPDLATASSCAHPICATGSKLASSCDPCATKVCGKDSYCCVAQWNSICVAEVSSICGKSCP